ncbi:hypothetical protein DOE76_11205 [Leifsonia sp. ku-ls]|nr:hypothetical protein DOE76_11205 [Leifsonia sp. ku-ls]
MTNADGTGRSDGEYLDEAGYPDGKGTLDEGTGAFAGDEGTGAFAGDEGTGAFAGDEAAGPTGDEAADDGGRDDTGLEGEAVVDELTEFDGADRRDDPDAPDL